MTSIFIFISGATLLVYSAERLIGWLIGVSRGLAISPSATSSARS